MSTITHTGNQKKKIIAAALIIGAAAIGGIIVIPRFLSETSTVAPIAQAEVKTVEEGQAGPVGDLVITEEAMKLAEITVAPVMRQVVNEKLALSGEIETTSNGLAEITPRVGGKVVKVLASTGDHVSAGQTLAILESPELAQAQAMYHQASARVDVAEDNLSRQKKLADLGAFGSPRMEDAQRASVSAQNDVKTAEAEVKKARAEVSRAESELDSLKAVLRQVETQEKVATSKFNRAEALLKDQLISKQEWEQIQADKEKAEADVVVAKAKVKQARANIETAEAALGTATAKMEAAQKRGGIESAALSRERAVYEGGYATSREIVEAEAALKEARLDQQAASQAVRLAGGVPGKGNSIAVVSPISGAIQSRSVTLGEVVNSEHSLFTVVNLNEVWAYLPVSPRDLEHVRVGEAVELESEALPGHTFVGKVVSIGSVADSTTRAVPVRIALENKQGLLRPGTFVKANIITDVRHEQIVVPESAIQDHINKKTLYVALGTPGDFEVRHVLLGATQDGLVEIKEGLEGNESVAVSGTFYLKSEALKSYLSDGCCGAGE